MSQLLDYPSMANKDKILNVMFACERIKNENLSNSAVSTKKLTIFEMNLQENKLTVLHHQNL